MVLPGQADVPEPSSIGVALATTCNPPLMAAPHTWVGTADLVRFKIARLPLWLPAAPARTFHR